MARFQTLSGFLLSPFGTPEDLTKDMTYASKYRSFVATNSIKLVAVCEIEDSYYYHLHIPSESKDGKYNYDVVIRFFTDKEELKRTNSLRGYFIQFFSNCPSFMYQYAYIYKQEGFLIEALYNKLDADYIDTPPTKSNAKMVKSYDKSIYYACRYLSEKKFTLLEKNGINNLKKVSPDRFFRGISDFKSVKIDTYILGEEKKLAKALEKDKDKTGGKAEKVVSRSLKNKVLSTFGTTPRVKAGGRVAKKGARKSTNRK